MKNRLVCFNIETATKNLWPWNENYWKDRNVEIRKMLSMELPDVLCLQESTILQNENLDKYLCDKLNYERIGKYTNISITMSDCNSIYYRKDKYRALTEGTFWISDTPSKKNTKYKNSEYYRNCNWVRLIDRTDTKNDFYVFNIHVNWGECAEKSFNLIYSKIIEIAGSGSKVIVCGDYNCYLDSKDLKVFRDNLDNVREKCGISEKELTYHGRGNGKNNAAIDHIFSRSIKDFKYRLIYYTGKLKYLSDHYPMEIDF